MNRSTPAPFSFWLLNSAAKDILCENPSMTEDALATFLNLSPESGFLLDANGETPLDLLARNDNLSDGVS